MSMSGHDLRQLVTRAQHDLTRLDRKAIFRHRQSAAFSGLDIGDLVGREKPCAELLGASEKSRSEGPRISRYTSVAHNRRSSRQVEASAKLTAVEILAGQSDSYTGTNLVGESTRIENISRKINRRVQTHRSANPFVSSQLVKGIKRRFES